MFLSKFDRKGLKYLGFAGFAEAYNAFGYSLQARPASIKNYRDEVDPCFPNARKGWHKRPVREHCQRILDQYAMLSLAELGEIIKGLLLPAPPAETIQEVKRVLELRTPDPSASFAKRLITGRAAERYFVAHCAEMAEFAGARLTDTTGWGCGFDFKVMPQKSSTFYAVEVKGLQGRSGQIQMTDLEFEVAEVLRDRYFLVLVRNFVELPFHTVINNPTKSAIHFTRVERQETRLSWHASVGD